MRWPVVILCVALLLVLAFLSGSRANEDDDFSEFDDELEVEVESEEDSFADEYDKHAEGECL